MTGDHVSAPRSAVLTHKGTRAFVILHFLLAVVAHTRKCLQHITVFPIHCSPPRGVQRSRLYCKMFSRIPKWRPPGAKDGRGPVQGIAQEPTSR